MDQNVRGSRESRPVAAFRPTIVLTSTRQPNPLASTGAHYGSILARTWPGRGSCWMQRIRVCTGDNLTQMRRSTVPRSKRTRSTLPATVELHSTTRTFRREKGRRIRIDTIAAIYPATPWICLVGTVLSALLALGGRTRHGVGTASALRDFRQQTGAVKHQPYQPRYERGSENALAASSTASGWSARRSAGS